MTNIRGMAPGYQDNFYSDNFGRDTLKMTRIISADVNRQQQAYYPNQQYQPGVPGQFIDQNQFQQQQGFAPQYQQGVNSNEPYERAYLQHLSEPNMQQFTPNMQYEMNGQQQSLNNQQFDSNVHQFNPNMQPFDMSEPAPLPPTFEQEKDPFASLRNNAWNVNLDQLESMQNTSFMAQVTMPFVAQTNEEISLNPGDVVIVRAQDEHWWTVEFDGRSGLYPAAYLSPVN